MNNPKRYLITAALPYANGPVHIGHLAGCYLPADIYVRYLRSQKRDVKFIGGSDEHGVPITIRAMKEGITPQQVVDKFHAIIKESMQQMNISFDIYARTSDKIHHDTASAFFKKMYDDGSFEEKVTEQYYDETTKTFLADRYITGTCPVCGNPNAYGDQCEKCGTSLSPEQLINPRSALSDAVPVKKETKHWYFPLQNYEAWLKEWIIEGHKEWKNNVYGQCKSWLDKGLQSRAMTRDSSWGIKVPTPPAAEGGEGKVLYVWFDAPIGYISATKELTAQWADYWCREDTKLVHFIGKDNIVFHCIIFPAMLKAHGGFVLPDNVPANEFLNIEGEKVSTSRNWAVWVNEYIKDFPGCEDALRYVLCANAPETKDNDFTWKDFQDRNNSELVNIFGNFVNRTWVLMHKLCKGKVPKLHEDILDEKDKALIEEIRKAKSVVEKNIEEYKFRDALFEIIDLSRKGNKYMQEKEPWILAKKASPDPSKGGETASPSPSEGGELDSGDNENYGYQTADPVMYGLLKKFVAEHRSKPTEAENVLWQLLRGKNLDGYKFRRQHIIGSYIADFVSLSHKLIIEVDGLIHQSPENMISDEARTAELNSYGFEVIRFTNDEILTNPERVLKIIATKIENNQKALQTQNPLLGGRGAASPSPSEGGELDSGDNENYGYQTADPVMYGLLKKFVAEHRSKPTEAENVLWQLLRVKNLDGYKFRRQHIIGSYIADFVSLSHKLIIEVDGLIHQSPENMISDEARTAELNSYGFEVIRFINDEILTNPERVLKIIATKIENNQKALQTPNPLLGGRGAASPSPSEGGELDSGDNENYGYQTADPVMYGLLKKFVAEHRSKPTEAENVLWQLLRGKNLDGYKFRRQHIIGSYIADFASLSQKLIIEVDGLIHQSPQNMISDEARTAELNSYGFEVIRFTNDEILTNPERVLKIIATKIENNQKALQTQNPLLGGRGAQEAIDNCLHLCLQLTANLAILINPFLPSTAKKMIHMMKVVDKMLDWENAGKIKLLSVGYSLREPELLFRKIEDTEIAAQVQKLKAGLVKTISSIQTHNGHQPLMDIQTKKPMDETSQSPEPVLKPTIQFDDFAKIDLKTGTIIAAEKVEKADKLLKLEVDMGFEKRTIVSGIAGHFEPGTIIGKQVIVVANLAPRKMRGIESNGMILLAQNQDGKLIFINPDENVDNGSNVS